MQSRRLLRSRSLAVAALVCAGPAAALVPAVPGLARASAEASAPIEGDALPPAVERHVSSDMVVDWLEEPPGEAMAWLGDPEAPADHGVPADGGTTTDAGHRHDPAHHDSGTPTDTRYEAATDGGSPAPQPGHGFAVFSPSARWLPGGYTIRLTGDGRIEEYRDELAAAARAATHATGLPVRVATELGGPTEPRRGEITVALGTGPCGASALGCGGPRLTSTSVVAGQVWIHPRGLGLAHGKRLNLAAHELGHALGLRHYTSDWGDGRQVMYPVVSAVPPYRAGDGAGLRFLAGGYDRPAGEITGVGYAAGQVWVTGTVASGERVRLAVGPNRVDVAASGGSFSGAVPAAAGPHRICAASLDAAPGWRRTLGCTQITAPGAPFGRLEAAAGAFETVQVSGWAIDPQTAEPVEVQVRRNGSLVATAAADRNRRDVARLHPQYGRAHGFRLDVPAVAGVNELCVRALGVGGGGDTDLGCRQVTHAVDPIGAFEAAHAEDLGATVSGWALDPNTPHPIEVAITVDGAVPAAPNHVRADDDRPDVTRQHPAHGPAHGFSQRIVLAPGEHEICLTARNAGLGADRSIGCRRVTVPAPAGATGTVDGVAGGAVDGLPGTASRVAPADQLVPEALRP